MDLQSAVYNQEWVIMARVRYVAWTNEFESFLKLPILLNTLRQAACKSLGGGQSAMMHFISMIDPEYH